MRANARAEAEQKRRSAADPSVQITDRQERGPPCPRVRSDRVALTMLVKRRGELHGTAPSQSWQLIGTKARRAGFQPAGSGGIPAAQRSAGKDARRTGSQDRYPTTARSTGSLLSLLRTHWDHEPLRLTEARSGPRVCDPQPARFMESHFCRVLRP